jgi:arginine N-succinyltransferase
MLRIRPARIDDHTEILQMAQIAGIGMSSLPQDEDILHSKILYSIKSFAGTLARKPEENFLFVMEDMEKRRLAGTASIAAHVGLSRPFYSYKSSTLTQASTALGIYSLHHVLHMVNDYTNATIIGSLFLHPDYRRDGLGRFLSRSRYLMLAAFPDFFSDVVISEIRGAQDENGESPFYNHLARHFFQMDFRQADYIYATQGPQFIADLMPKYPVYVNLLAKEAQEAIGVPFSASLPAMKLLQAEGFRYEGYVDLFDAGPTLEVERGVIRTVRKCQTGICAEFRPLEDFDPQPPHLVSNLRCADFTIAQSPVLQTNAGLALSVEAAEALKIRVKDKVQYVL